MTSGTDLPQLVPEDVPFLLDFQAKVNWIATQPKPSPSFAEAKSFMLLLDGLTRNYPKLRSPAARAWFESLLSGVAETPTCYGRPVVELFLAYAYLAYITQMGELHPQWMNRRHRTQHRSTTGTSASPPGFLSQTVLSRGRFPGPPRSTTRLPTSPRRRPAGSNA